MPNQIAPLPPSTPAAPAAPLRPAAQSYASQALAAGAAAADSPARSPDPQAAPGAGEVRDAVKKIEQLVHPDARDLRFSIDEDTGITVVKLIDTATQTVLRQIPTPEVLEISKALDKLQGLLVKDKA